jgi:[amino group carrier protein]-lysine/ornithine hydrolase
VSVDPVKLLTDAVRIYSPSEKEGRLAAYLTRQMKSLGYRDVHLDKGGNAVGEIGSGDLRVLLCGHMDTVPGDLPVRSEKGVLYGRGASDAKSPLCALLVAGSRAAGSGVRMTFVGATREEGDGLGIRTVIESGRRFDYAVFGEPGGFNRVAVGYRGRVGLRVTIRTEGGHAASPWAHESALDEFYLLLGELRKFEKGTLEGEDHFRSVSISPTMVSAGSYHNVLPGTCDATFDVRVPPGRTCASIEDEIGAIMDRFAAKRSCTVDFTFDERTEPYEADPNSPLVRAFQRAIILKAKSRPVMTRKTGTGDMNTLAAAMDVKCVTYGPGESLLSHTEEERVSIEDYLKSVEVLAETMAQLKALARKT